MAYKLVTISVRNLVEFILRSGDIDTVSGSLSELDAMQKGGRMHRKIQKAAGPAYRAEVSLKLVTDIDESLSIKVEGRADGIITESEMAADETGMLTLQEVVTVDEIKCTYRDLKHITEPVPVHLAQAMCYAYFYALDEGLEKINVQLTYAHLENGRIKRFVEKMDFLELEIWYTELIEKYATWAKWQIEWELTRNKSISACSFPFPYRDSQKKLVSGVYQTILRKKRLFAQAPTGTGKTIATLYPAVQAMGNGQGEKIFYLTARTIARTVAEDTMALLQTRGLSMKVITLTAKDKICIFDEALCNPEHCPRAKGHYDRVNEAVYDMINHEDRMTREALTAYAQKHNVCPFEFQLDVSLWADVIICDYNYVFDPDVALKRFFSDRSGDYLFLVDESHNLVDRAREMYSAVLSLSDFEIVKKIVKGVDKKFSERLNKCINYLISVRDMNDAEAECMDSVSAMMVYLTKLNESMEAVLKQEMKADAREKLMDLFFAVRKFVNAYDRMDGRYLLYVMRRKKDVSVKIFCVDPSKDISERLSIGRSAVFFSATLLPIQYYKEMLSDTSAEDYDLYVDSPFDTANRLLIAADDVSTKYSRRGPREYEKIAGYIRQIVHGRHGNYMVFFPSYQLMRDVFDVFTEQTLVLAGHGLNVVVQENAMDEAKRQSFLDEFQADSSRATLGFCVMGGIFSEGIDLKADRLIGAIIVGTGLPQVGFERELLMQYFDEKSGNGFDYAYLYPGMNKVFQAGGRVIRTEADRGIIALLDERFQYGQYRRIFPRDWLDCQKTSLTRVADQIESFWTEKMILDEKK